MNKNNDYQQVEIWRNLVENYLEKNKRIDDNFFEDFFGKQAQARFLSGTCEDLHDAMIMNGLAGIDCRKFDFSKLSLKNYTKIPFDSNTKFPEDIADVFSTILEKSKKFGFGLEVLINEEKLSGEGINIAVIDENFDSESIDKNEINIVSHDEYSTGDHYHGKTVCSLLASKSCGVAKGANIFFYEKTSEEYRRKKDEYQKLMPPEEFSKWKKQSGNDEWTKNIKKIKEYNENCIQESDKITVLSGSWSMPSSEFEKWQQALRVSGCELVCQNNFIQNFTEISEDDIILEMSEKEKESFSTSIRRTIDSVNLNTLVKIPINRTYHQFGTNNGFKYQASYSNSWGIPQVAGLLALYKAKDKSLTFEDFCNLCKNTADEKGIINPVGIYYEIERRMQKENQNISNIYIEDEDR